MNGASTPTGWSEVVLTSVGEYESDSLTGFYYCINSLELHHHGDLLSGYHSLWLVPALVIPDVHRSMPNPNPCLHVLHLDEDLPSVE